MTDREAEREATGSDDGASSRRDEGTEGDVSWAERVAMIGSVLFTAALFGFVAWHALTGAGLPASPEASVTPIGPDRYEVELANPTDRGLESATVVVRCGRRARTLVFANVPASGSERGTVVCPRDDGPPSVEVVQWTRP